VTTAQSPLHHASTSTLAHPLTQNVSEADGHKAQFDVVVDATGSPQGLRLAAGLCRPMGTLVLKSTCAEGEKFNAAPFVIDELRVVGSRCGPFPEAIQLLERGDLDI
jgi:threonine dehydrogenase-like Zn-dependent dehydrogenase